MLAKAAQASLRSLTMNKEIRSEKKKDANEEDDALTKLLNDVKEE